MIKKFWKDWARFKIRHSVIGDPTLIFILLALPSAIFCFYQKCSPNLSDERSILINLIAYCMLALLISLIWVDNRISEAKEILPEIALKKVAETEGFSEVDFAMLRILESKARLLDDATLLMSWLKNFGLVQKGLEGMSEAMRLTQET